MEHKFKADELFDFIVDESEDASRRWLPFEGMHIDYTPFELLEKFKDLFDDYYPHILDKYPAIYHLFHIFVSYLFF